LQFFIDAAAVFGLTMLARRGLRRGF